MRSATERHTATALQSFDCLRADVSYDLYFHREREFGGDEPAAFFLERQWYQVSDGQAWYANDDTGVYFSFEWGEDIDGEEEEPVAAFNLNYYRPHFFPLEAAAEVEAFVEQFSLRVEDPQVDGMEDGQFTREGFLRGWNQGNRVAYRACVGENVAPQDVLVRPTEELEKIWQWNQARRGIQEAVGDDIFVPRILWILYQERLHSAVVWTDGIPALIPDVESVVVVREQLAPRRWLIRRPDTCVVAAEQLAGILPPLDAGDYPLAVRSLDYQSAPQHVTQFIQSLPAPRDALEPVPHDSVLNQELLEEATK